MAEPMRQAVDNTIKFLRMAAIELRRIAHRAPDVAEELRHVADQLEADAAELQQTAAGQR